MRKGARVGGGKVKVNENGEVYIERRGRKPGSGKVKNQVRITPSTSCCPQPSSVGIARRRSSARNSIRKGDSKFPNVHLASLMRKYGSRRSLLFKAVRPLRSPTTRATLITRDAIWHANTLFQVGDIVAITDEDNGLPYFAQIRGLITDPLVRHHAALTWY
uniref:BAH domain-containing protein n=1 Tax=Heterorhabditis bacteriophora TaxID=37862 RepID=A0A1I7WZQ3_HETBA